MKHLKKFNEMLDPMGKWNSEDDNDVQNPKFTDKNCEDFLLRLGVDITKSTGEYKPGVPEEPNCGIRMWPSKNGGGDRILYSFKLLKDFKNFLSYLKDNNIEYSSLWDGNIEGNGSRYPFQVVLNKRK